MSAGPIQVHTEGIDKALSGSEHAPTRALDGLTPVLHEEINPTPNESSTDSR